MNVGEKCNKWRQSYWQAQMALWRTGDSEVRVRLDLARQIASKTLEHAGVVREQAVYLQTAANQDSVSGSFHGAYGNSILIPHYIWLRNTCRAIGRGVLSNACTHTCAYKHTHWCTNPPRAWHGMSTTFSISAVMCLSGSFTNWGCSAQSSVELFVRALDHTELNGHSWWAKGAARGKFQEWRFKRYY